ncbi:MAG: sugar phosphate nucleotidyltransferase [Candidatus Omnitrophica bacterium]|nr:sugar phosphate nucleotidyltransferase [Candidatus Omnitrophota bacterium]
MKAVILAGGLGSRLKPFTEVIPKPLLPIGESSVLEIEILCLKKYGVTEIFVATNFMSEYVETFFAKHQKKYGIPVNFSKEDKPLGTCGPIKLLKDKLTEPFLLMNGDILTTLDFSKLYSFALTNDTDLTVVTKEIETPFHFGKVISDGHYLSGVQEKPDFKFEILAGIYILKPPVFELIPDDTYYGIDTLIKDMLNKKRKVAKYLMKEYWLDIGQIEDYKIAQDAYKKHFDYLKL